MKLMPFPFMPSKFLVTLGESLRMLLDNVVQGLPLQNTAGELVKDFTTFSLSLHVRFNYCFVKKNKEIPIGRAVCDFFFMRCICEAFYMRCNDNAWGIFQKKSKLKIGLLISFSFL